MAGVSLRRGRSQVVLRLSRDQIGRRPAHMRPGQGIAMTCVAVDRVLVAVIEPSADEVRWIRA